MPSLISTLQTLPGMPAEAIRMLPGVSAGAPAPPNNTAQPMTFAPPTPGVPIQPAQPIATTLDSDAADATHYPSTTNLRGHFQQICNYCSPGGACCNPSVFNGTETSFMICWPFAAKNLGSGGMELVVLSIPFEFLFLQTAQLSSHAGEHPLLTQTAHPHIYEVANRFDVEAIQHNREVSNITETPAKILRAILEQF